MAHDGPLHPQADGEAGHARKNPLLGLVRILQGVHRDRGRVRFFGVCARVREGTLWRTYDRLAKRYGYTHRRIGKLPVSYVAAVEDLVEQEEKDEAARWLSGLHIQALGTYAGLVDHKGLSPTREEQKQADKKTDNQIKAERAGTEQFLQEFRKSITSAQRFGAFVGRPDIFGAPPPERVRSAEEIRASTVNLDEELTANLAAAFEGLVEAKKR